MQTFERIFDQVPPAKRRDFFDQSLTLLAALAKTMTGGESMVSGIGTDIMRRYGLDPNNGQHLALYLAHFQELDAKGRGDHSEAARLAARDVQAAETVIGWQASGHEPTPLDKISLWTNSPRGELPENQDNTPKGQIDRHFRETGETR